MFCYQCEYNLKCYIQNPYESDECKSNSYTCEFFTYKEE